MKLIVVNSNSSGNAYALDAGEEILLLEAGCKMADVKRAIDFRLKDIVGCCVSHAHGDHAKYATEYAKFGVNVYCNQHVSDNKQFPYDKCHVIKAGKTYRIGSFSITPFDVAHDIPCMGFLIKHQDSGVMLFVTDTFKVPITITGIDHYLIEANYADDLLRKNVWDGKVDKSQADRIMLSHMSLNYTVKYLIESGGINAKTITLCHLSERNSDPVMFRNVVQGALGVPCNIATKGLTVELSKEII